MVSLDQLASSVAQCLQYSEVKDELETVDLRALRKENYLISLEEADRKNYIESVVANFFDLLEGFRLKNLELEKNLLEEKEVTSSLEQSFSDWNRYFRPMFYSSLYHNLEKLEGLSDSKFLEKASLIHSLFEKSVYFFTCQALGYDVRRGVHLPFQAFIECSYQEERVSFQSALSLEVFRVRLELFSREVTTLHIHTLLWMTVKLGFPLISFEDQVKKVNLLFKRLIDRGFKFPESPNSVLENVIKVSPNIFLNGKEYRYLTFVFWNNEINRKVTIYSGYEGSRRVYLAFPKSSSESVLNGYFRFKNSIGDRIDFVEDPEPTSTNYFWYRTRRQSELALGSSILGHDPDVFYGIPLVKWESLDCFTGSVACLGESITPLQSFLNFHQHKLGKDKLCSFINILIESKALPESFNFLMFDQEDSTIKLLFPVSMVPFSYEKILDYLYQLFPGNEEEFFLLFQMTNLKHTQEAHRYLEIVHQFSNNRFIQTRSDNEQRFVGILNGMAIELSSQRTNPKKDILDIYLNQLTGPIVLKSFYTSLRELPNNIPLPEAPKSLPILEKIDVKPSQSICVIQ